MICLHVVKPKCGRPDGNYVDPRFVCVCVCVCVWCRFVENKYVIFCKKDVTRIPSVFHWNVSCS